MRKSIAVLAVALFLAAPRLASADDGSAQTSGSYDRPGTFGVGLTTSDFLFGPTIKAYVGGAWALQFSTGFGYYPGLLGYVLNGDVLYEFPRFLSIDVLSMNWYLGAGATFGYSVNYVAVGFFGNTGAAALYGGGQTLGGVGLQFRKVPIEVTFELQTTFLGVSVEQIVHPAWFEFVFGAGFSGRYFF